MEEVEEFNDGGAPTSPLVESLEDKPPYEEKNEVVGDEGETTEG
jgi:hypothetical protein